MRPLSVRTRLLIWLLPPLAVVLVSAAVGLYTLQRELLVQEFDRQLDRRVFAASRALMRFRGPPPQERQEEMDLEGLIFVELWDLPARTLRASLPASHSSSAPLVAVPESPGPAHETVTLPDGREARIYAWHMRAPERPSWPRRGGRDGDPNRPRDPNRSRDPNERAGDADSLAPPPPPPEFSAAGEPNERRPRRGSRGDHLLIAAGDLAGLNAQLRRWSTWLTLACAGGLGLVALIVLVGVRRGLRPLRTLAVDIAGIDDRSLRHRIHAEAAPPELAPVVRQLNALLERLAQAFDRERAFLASAAHELRTPLAAVRSQVEVALRRPRQVENYQQTLQQCLQSVIALERMVGSLLQVARLEGGHHPPMLETVDVAGLLREHLSASADSMARRGLDLREDLPETLTLDTDRQLLTGIVSNLVSNAADYADVGTWVRVQARRNDGRLELIVANPAASLRPQDVDRVFEPFWRADQARSQPAAHAGIGLCVVRQCVLTLGGTIDARLGSDHVLEFALHLPELAKPNS